LQRHDKLAEFSTTKLAEVGRISLGKKFGRRFGAPGPARWVDRRGGLCELAGRLGVDGWLAGRLAGALAGRRGGSDGGLSWLGLPGWPCLGWAWPASAPGLSFRSATTACLPSVGGASLRAAAVAAAGGGKTGWEAGQAKARQGKPSKQDRAGMVLPPRAATGLVKLN